MITVLLLIGVSNKGSSSSGGGDSRSTSESSSGGSGSGGSMAVVEVVDTVITRVVFMEINDSRSRMRLTILVVMNFVRSFVQKNTYHSLLLIYHVG